MELYVHIPFCVRKCRYCSFASFAASEAEQEAYIRLLLKEAGSRRGEMTEPVSTVYIGGGTPSLLPPRLFRGMADGLRGIFGLDDVTEFTSEANPGTVTREWLDTAAAAGVNRLSFGMQAFREDLLCLLGRIHRFGDVQDSVAMAREAGFSNISLDLMFGIPTQTRSMWKETLDHALSLHPEHISAYGLIPEEGTPLFRDLESGALSLPDPEEEREMYDDAIKLLSANGFRQYEISNFALHGRECAHNIGYWTQVPYLGLGLSAASMTAVRTGPEGMSYRRMTNPDTFEAYRQSVETENPPQAETVTAEEARFETMMLGLRMNRGVSIGDFMIKHGLSPDECFGDRLHSLEERGIVIRENGFLRLSRRGFDIQNSILVELMD